MHVVTILGALALTLTLGAPPTRATPAEPESAPDEVLAPVEDARSESARSPCRADKRPPKVFALGGSTMQIVLGPMFTRRLGKLGMQVDYRGRAASGLARYDFFDWPGTVKALLAEHDPDVFVVALGSNDGQSLRELDGRWHRLDRPGWEEEYARRVDAFLDLLAGPGRRRAILWSGPAAHADDAKRARGAVVSRIIRERIRAFPGRAWYVDLFGRTSTADGGARQLLRRPGEDAAPLRKSDGFHLTLPGVEALMYEPVATLLAPCHGPR